MNAKKAAGVAETHAARAFTKKTGRRPVDKDFARNLVREYERSQMAPQEAVAVAVIEEGGAEGAVPPPANAEGTEEGSSYTGSSDMSSSEWVRHPTSRH